MGIGRFGTRGSPRPRSTTASVIELIERNVHLNLTLTALSQALARAMRGPHSGNLYVPLAEADAFAVG